MESLRRFGAWGGGWQQAASTAALAAFMASAPATGAVEAQTIGLPPADAVAPVQFTKIVSIRELSDGALLVADGSENRVVHVEWEGRVHEVGRTGRGPLEYEYVGRLYGVEGDSTLFTDSPTRRWNLLEGGRVIETLSEHRHLNQLLGSRLSGADTSGHVLGVTGFLFSGPRRVTAAADSLLLLLADWRTERLDTIARLAGTGQAGFTRIPPREGRPQALVGGNPLDAGEQALLFPDGVIAVARPEPYSVDWRFPDGRWVRGDPLPFERREVTRREQCAAMVGFLPLGPRCDPDLLTGWPDEVPPFLRALSTPVLLAAPDGRLVIARTPSPDRAGRRYDVVDRTGRREAVLELPPGAVLMAFGVRSAYVVTTGDFDLQTITRHPWP